MEIKRVGIIGCGPMGTSLAGLLQKDVPVVIVARNKERITTLLTDGVKYEDERLGGSEIQRPLVVGRIEDLKQFDDLNLIFIATKSSAIKSVCAELKSVIHEDLFLVSYQNGINPGIEIMNTLSTDRVIRMILNYGAGFNEKAQVVINFYKPPHFIGTLNKEYKSLCLEIATLLRKSGLEVDYTEEIELEIWKKSLLNAAASPVCALTQTTLKEAMNSPTEPLVRQLLKEGIDVASKEGIPLPDNYYDACINYLNSAGDHYPSMVSDIQHKSPTEITQLNQQIMELGHKHGVKTIAHESIVSLIKTIDLKALAKK